MTDSQQRDVYASFSALSRVQREEIDYRIRTQQVTGSSTTIVAPHAGGIEIRTSRIARSVAGKEFNLYLFEGLKSSGNRSLHITSHRFDERQCLSLLAESRTVVTIHGCKGQRHVIYLGGLNHDLKARLSKGLRAAGFTAKMNFHPFRAIHPKNICNRGATGAGVQLELSRGLRLNGDLRSLVSTIRGVLLVKHST